MITCDYFIAPSLPLQGDQAVDAHAARAPAPPYSGGRVWSIVLCVSRGDDLALQMTYVILGHCSKEFVITGY